MIYDSSECAASTTSLDRVTHLWQEGNTLQALRLEYGHDCLDDLVMVISQRLVLQDVQQCVDGHSLVVVVGRS